MGVLRKITNAIFGEPWPEFWAASSARLRDAAIEARRGLECMDVPPPVPSTRLPGEAPADYDD